MRIRQTLHHLSIAHVREYYFGVALEREQELLRIRRDYIIYYCKHNYAIAHLFLIT